MGDLELDFRADRDRCRRRAREKRSEARGLGGTLYSDRALAARRQLRLVEVDDNEERLGREKLKAAQSFEVLALEVQ